MRLRPCLDCPALTNRPRCPACRSARERLRGSAAARGYGRGHRQRRADLAPSVAEGTAKCWRCGGALDPDNWTLGHCDDDRSIYHGPECPPCDYATAGRTRCPHPSHN